jgi:hypothetical protein
VDDAVGVELLNTLGDLSKNHWQLSVISLLPQILSEVVFIVGLGERHMVVGKVGLFQAKDMLQPVDSSHSAHLVLFLHSDVDFRLSKHVKDKEILVDYPILDLSVYSSLLLNIKGALDGSFVSKVLKEGEVELVSKDALQSRRGEGREGVFLALLILSLKLSLGAWVLEGLPGELYSFVNLDPSFLKLLLRMELAIVLLEVGRVTVDFITALAHEHPIFLDMLHVLGLMVLMFEFNVPFEVEFDTKSTTTFVTHVKFGSVLCHGIDGHFDPLGLRGVWILLFLFFYHVRSNFNIFMLLLLDIFIESWLDHLWLRILLSGNLTLKKGSSIPLLNEVMSVTTCYT